VPSETASGKKREEISEGKKTDSEAKARVRRTLGLQEQVLELGIASSIVIAIIVDESIAVIIEIVNEVVI